MEDHTDDNKIIESNIQQENLEYHFNFANTPWDDRSKKSKAGILILLISIFVVTMALVVNSFIMHYKGFKFVKIYNNSIELSCFRVKMDDYPYVARIHSVATQQLLCLGAVVSRSTVVTNGVCAKSGPIRMFLGSISNPRCKKGFSVDVIDSVHHDGVISKRLVLLSSYESIEFCSEVIKIGKNLNWSGKVHILGRPIAVGRTLSLQHANLAGKNFGSRRLNKHVDSNSTICVKDIVRCPVRAGDLLLQNDKLFGFSSTSVQRDKVACFADLNIVKQDLKEADEEISTDID
uniref:Peptidase S1 domain-containing protein n=1 Tax=Heliothis virescens TaxID=7102 RepID=A0A2A4K883_HELVI